MSSLVQHRKEWDQTIGFCPDPDNWERYCKLLYSLLSQPTLSSYICLGGGWFADAGGGSGPPRCASVVGARSYKESSYNQHKLAVQEGERHTYQE